MIVSLCGILVEKEPNFVVIECAGVGYEVSIPVCVYNELPPLKGECRLHVRHIVREDKEQLFGFAKRSERDLFDMLIEVSGVGAKTALCILSGLSVDELKRCIVEGDAKRIGTVKGIGKKTAERIIVDLRGKIDPVEALGLSQRVGVDANDSVLHDTMAALIRLGYAQEQAQRMIQKALDGGADSGRVEDLLRRAIASQ